MTKDCEKLLDKKEVDGGKEGYKSEEREKGTSRGPAQRLLDPNFPVTVTDSATRARSLSSGENQGR